VFNERVQSRGAKREATQQKVLASAEQLFRQHGFSATTIRQIAADADVSIGTVMAVGDKDALLIAIVDGWIAAVHRGRTGNCGDSRSPLAATAAVQEVMSVIEPFIEYLFRDQQLSRAYAAIIVRGRHESAIFQDLALALIAEINAALSRSSLTPAAAGRGARAIYFSYLGILIAAGSGAFTEQEVVDQLREVVSFVISPQGEQQ
jgi:AcrR family transcriptional regulator